MDDGKLIEACTLPSTARVRRPNHAHVCPLPAGPTLGPTRARQASSDEADGAVGCHWLPVPKRCKPKQAEWAIASLLVGGESAKGGLIGIGKVVWRREPAGLALQISRPHCFQVSRPRYGRYCFTINAASRGPGVAGGPPTWLAGSLARLALAAESCQSCFRLSARSSS